MRLAKLLIVCTLTALLIPAGFRIPSVNAHHAQSAPKDRAYYESRGQAVWEAPTERKVIALTFDDGPDPEQTPQILDLLNKYHAKATFFVIGENVRLHPEIVRREAADGFEVANHTDHHIRFTNRSPAEKIHEEIVEAGKIIVETTGQPSRLFRPPGGFYNERLIETANQSGNLVVMWSWHQDTKDWMKPGVGSIIQTVLKNARNGDIILLHDHVNGKSQTIPALSAILPELEKRGYRFVTVSELLHIAAFPSQWLNAASVPATPQCDVLIDVGHGGIDGGTSAAGVLEKDINLQIARRLYARLRQDGYRAVLSRNGDYAMSDENGWLRHPSRHRRDLAQRAHLAQALSPKLLISLHVNWAARSSDHGPYVLYRKRHWQSQLGAQIMQSALNRYYGTRQEPEVGKRFYLLNYAKCPAMIVEMGYISHPGDRARLTGSRGQQELAAVMGDAAEHYLELMKMLPLQPPISASE